MVRNISLATAVLVALFLAVGCGSGVPKDTAATTTKAKVTIVMPAQAAKTLARPIGTVNDITSITLDATSGGSNYATGFAFTQVEGVWGCEVPSLPVGPLVIFTAHAYNGSGTEIFTGTVGQHLVLQATNNISIVLSSVDNGLPIVLPGIQTIIKPEQILTDNAVDINLTIKGGLLDVLTYLITPAPGGGTFSSESGMIFLDGTAGSLYEAYTAPSVPGTYTHKIRISNTSGDYIETTFNTYVVTQYTAPAQVSVEFVPVVEKLYGVRTGSDLTFEAVVVDDAPTETMAYQWGFDGGLAFTDIYANPTTLLNYTESTTGLLTLSVTDNYGEGHTTNFGYNLPAGQFPDSLTIHSLDLQLVGSGTGVVRGNYIDTTASLLQEYDHGTTVMLIAVPDLGTTFAGWGGACSGMGVCTVVMGQNELVTATFTLIP